MGSTKIEQPAAPAAPSATETTAQAIAAQQQSIPAQLALQQQYGPQFAQLELEQLQNLAGPYSQAILDVQQKYGPQYAQNMLAEQQILSPELRPAQELLAQQMSQEDLLTPYEQRELEQSSRAARQSAGLAQTGFGAMDELNRMTQARQALKTQRLNLALSTAGRQTLPSASGAVIPNQAYGVGQVAQSVTPSQIFGLAQSNYGTQASIYNTQSQMAAQQAQMGNPFGSVLGTIGGTALGAFTGGWGTAAGTAFGTPKTSSILLKKDVEDITYALDVVNKIEGVTYKWKENNLTDGGVIAEELEKVLPDAVCEVDGIKSIKPMMLIGYLIEAIKELSSKIGENNGK